MKNDENNILDYDISFKKQKAVSSTNNVSDPDKYIEFVSFYNEFINHRPKKFKPIKGEFVF